LSPGWRVARACPGSLPASGTTPRTVREWRDRHAAEGQAGLRDRSSRPHRGPTRQAVEVTARLEALRRPGPSIARRLGQVGSTVGLTLRRIGLDRLAALEPKPVIIRCEPEHPGELLHVDIEKLGRIDGIGHRITGNRTGQSSKRGTGWEYLRVAIDDASRLAFTAMPPDERKESAVAFLDAALAWFKAHGVVAQRVVTDDGSACRSKRLAEALARHAVTHKRTRPYTPRTNGEVERSIQTSIREWAHATPFETSAASTAAMYPWLLAYNTTRPHAALNGKAPVTRTNRDNVLGNDS